MALKQAVETPQRPPALRAGDARHRCGLCVYFDGKARCRLYSYPVRANQLSDSYQPIPAVAEKGV